MPSPVHHLPLELGEVRVAFGDGTHCAFTDMCLFRGSVYIAFRSSPKGHLVTEDAAIVVLRSQDQGESFAEVHRFRSPLPPSIPPSLPYSSLLPLSL